MEIKPIYLFYGEEKYLLQKDVSIFRRYFAREGITAEEFDGAKTSLAAVVAAAEEMPLFGDRRLLIVSNADWFGGKKKDDDDVAGGHVVGEEELLRYVASPNADTCLVFVAERVDKRKKVVKAIAEVGTVRAYEKKSGYELPNYVRDQLKKKGKTIAPKALDVLLEMTGDDIGVISGELDKLLLYIEDRGKIEVDDVRRIVAKTAEATLFDLADAIGSRRREKVDAILEPLTDSMRPGDYAMVFGFIVNHFRLLLRVKEQVDAGRGEKAIAKDLGVHPFRVQKAIRAVGHYSVDDLVTALDQLLACDFKVKTGRYSYADGFYLTVMNIVG